MNISFVQDGAMRGHLPSLVQILTLNVDNTGRPLNCIILFLPCVVRTDVVRFERAPEEMYADVFVTTDVPEEYTRAQEREREKGEEMAFTRKPQNLMEEMVYIWRGKHKYTKHLEKAECNIKTTLLQ